MKPNCRNEPGRGPRVPPPLLARIGAVFDHVGLVVEDLPAAVAGLSGLFGSPRERRTVEAVGLDAAVFETGALDLEVLCFAGATPGIDPRVFEASAGFQHLAFRVGDLPGAEALLREEGFQVLDGFPRPGVHGDILFFVAPGSGTLWELVEGRGEAIHGTGEKKG